MKQSNKIVVDFEDKPPINVDVVDNPKIDIYNKPSNPINANMNNQISIIMPKNHNELLGLDYESSGHTGFASEKRVNALEEKIIPKRLNALPDLDNTSPRSSCYIYVDNDGIPSKTNIKELLSKVIRADTNKPNDMENGDFLFLVKGDKYGN